MPDQIHSSDTDGKPRRKLNWRIVSLALVVILIVCALTVVAVVLLTPGKKSSNDNGYSGSKINLTEYLSGNFSGKGISARWISAGKLAYVNGTLKNGTIMLLTVNGDTVTTSSWLSSTVFSSINPVAWLPSPDHRYIAFAHNRTKLYRHSSFSLFTVIDTQNSSSVHNIGPTKTGMDLLRLFAWNPMAGSNDFAFVFENNMYYQSSLSSNATKLTSSGTKDGYIYNGVPDWLYEEEILGSASALWWSPDGQYLSFAEFNDSAPVPLIEYPLYHDLPSLYPSINKIPYSKCGEPIPTVKLWVWSTKTTNIPPVELKPPQAVSQLKEYYLFTVNWPSQKFTKGSDLSLVATWANRVQNKTYITICNYTQSQCYMNYKQDFTINGKKLWGLPSDYVIKYSTGDQYFVLLPQAGTDKNIYTGISSVSTSTGATRVLQNGNFDVQSIVGYSKTRNELYRHAFHIADPPLPMNRHLYKIVTTATSQTPQCITCDMQCGSVSATFDSGGDLYMLQCNGPGRPRLFLKHVTNNATLKLLSNNTDLGAYLATKALPVVQYTKLTLDNGYEVLVKLEMPPGTSISTTQKYPMILKVYGGPGSQIVGTNYGIGFDQYLVSNRRYIIAKFDVRGSGNRGWNYKTPLYHKFGTLEVQDQLNAALKLQSQFSFIDKNKTGVWGWSYGGFMTAHIVVADTGKFFKCAASVAPVTDFRYYDAAYTERYMGLPQSNQKGYDDSSVIVNATRFKDRNYMLIHGTGDVLHVDFFDVICGQPSVHFSLYLMTMVLDNVHFQNTVMLVKALTGANVQFNFMIYPNQQHSISGNRPHIWTLLDNYFNNCFQNSAKSE